MIWLYHLVFRPNPSTVFTSKTFHTCHTSHIAPGARLSVVKANLIFGGGENNIFRFILRSTDPVSRLRYIIDDMLNNNLNENELKHDVSDQIPLQ